MQLKNNTEQYTKISSKLNLKKQILQLRSKKIFRQKLPPIKKTTKLY